MNYMDSGKEVLMKFAEALKEYGEIDKNPKMEGKSIGIIINPKA